MVETGLSTNIYDFCRLCGTDAVTGIIIYSAEGVIQCLEEKILNCLRIEVSCNDLLPKRVCDTCRVLLEDYNRFCERATQVQQTLGLLLGLQMRHMQEQQEQADLLMLADIKMESIKNELDDLVLQPQLKVCEEQLQVMEEDTGTRHRRKMLQPKKTAVSSTGKQADHTGMLIEDDELGSIVCLMAEVENVREDEYKQINTSDMFQDAELQHSVVEEKLTKQDQDLSERVTVLEREWEKQIGVLCDRCGTIFEERALLEAHYRLTYSTDPVYSCGLCRRSLDDCWEYKEHITGHIMEPCFKCDRCQEGFYLESLRRLHTETCHDVATGSFICEHCGVSFLSKHKLVTHLKSHRSTRLEDFQCTECGKVLHTKGGLSGHMTVHKLGHRFMCDVCGKTFTQKVNMQQHVKLHKGERPFSCELCGKKFREKSHVNRHRRFHSEVRRYECPVCKKMYKTERCLKVHSQIHLNTRPFLCSHCGKGFLSSTKLKQHLNCHTGERPYVCKFCWRTFTNYPNCLKHTRRKHPGAKTDEAQNGLKQEDAVKVKGEALHVPQLEVRHEQRATASC